MAGQPHDQFMQRALELGRAHRTHPNPRVGAVVVDASGRVVGEGAHHGTGSDHAEVVALKAAGDRAKGSTLYVTLEPCTHTARTPPCVDAILAAGVSQVVVGSDDPDPRVSGRGISVLTQAGLSVTIGILEREARSIDEAYFHHRTTGLPLITLKYAMTLDGAVAAQDRSSQWITSELSRDDAQLLRAEADAVVVGAGTLRDDDPLLTVRLQDFDDPQPVPVVVAGREELPSHSRLWERAPLVVTAQERYIPAGTLLLVDGAEGIPDPKAAARALAGLGHLALLLEGGATLAGAWWRAGLITKGVAYLGGKLGGGQGMSPLGGLFSSLSEATNVSITAVRQLGPDCRIDFERSGH